MAKKHVLTNAKLWMDGYHLSGDLNALSCSLSSELQDSTTFENNGGRERLGGLKTIELNHEGYVNLDEDQGDKVIFDQIGKANVPMSFSQEGVEGDVAYTFLSILGTYNPNGNVGEMLSFSVSGEGSDSTSLIRGTLLKNATETTSGDGTAFQVGALASGKKLYAVLHVLSADGTTPTLDVKVQSDDAEGFAAPTDRVTFSQFADVGSEWATPVDGAITDDWWRVNFTIGGTNPEFKFVVIIGFAD